MTTFMGVRKTLIKAAVSIFGLLFSSCGPYFYRAHEYQQVEKENIQLADSLSAAIYVNQVCDTKSILFLIWYSSCSDNYSVRIIVESGINPMDGKHVEFASIKVNSNRYDTLELILQDMPAQRMPFSRCRENTYCSEISYYAFKKFMFSESEILRVKAAIRISSDKKTFEFT